MPIVKKQSNEGNTEEISLEDKINKKKAKKEKNIGKMELDEKKPKIDKITDESQE